MRLSLDHPYVRDEMLTKINGCAMNDEAIRADLIANMVAELRAYRAGQLAPEGCVVVREEELRALVRAELNLLTAGEIISECQAIPGTL